MNQVRWITSRYEAKRMKVNARTLIRIGVDCASTENVRTK